MMRRPPPRFRFYRESAFALGAADTRIPAENESASRGMRDALVEAMKTKQISRDEQVARLVAVMIEADLVLKCDGPWGSHTVGPYVKAVGPACFAAFGYGR